MEFKRITDMLDKAVQNCPDKIGFAEQDRKMTYREMRERSLKIAAAILAEFKEDLSALSEKDPQPAVTLMEGEIDITAAMHGILYAGDCYSVIDVAQPEERINKIIQSFQPRLMIISRHLSEKAKSLSFSGKILVYEDIMEAEPFEFEVPKIVCEEVSQKLAIVTFTSGSTGMPKGVMTGHNGILYQAVALCGFTYTEPSDHVGNQTSLYYALGELILFMSIAGQATNYFIPKALFSQPGELAEYMVRNRLTVLYWATSGLTIFSRFSAWEGYEEELNRNLKTVAFAGDVISTKLLNKMLKALPSPTYVQGYGCTEFYPPVGYHIERELRDDERIPIGFALPYSKVYLVKEDGTEAKDGEEGQIWIAGSGMGLGYLNDEEETKRKFRDNPLNPGERVFLTGDVARKNEYGELVFMTRKDFMIKHMGYRVELGEIELAATSLDDQLQCACVYNKEKEHIIMVYAGSLSPKELKARLKDKLPRHMVPNRFFQLDSLPLSSTSKIDRVKLKELYAGK